MVFTGYSPVPSFITNPTGGTTPQPSFAGAPYGSQPYTGELGQPGDPGYENTELGKWDQYIAQLQQALQASSGFQRWQIERQMEDARKGRDLQWKIAKLQSSGADARLVMQLKEQARQFDLNHGLEMQKLGLSRAQTATEYLSTPDRFFQAGDFLNMSARYLTGQPGAAPYGSTGSPTPKTEADFAILEQGGNPYAGRGDATQAVAGGGSGGDQRLKALQTVMKAVPPSEGMGLDANDHAVLQAARALYSTNLRPGTLESMRPGQRAIFQSAGKRLGYDVNDYMAGYEASRPNQQNVRAA